ncbi:hypothetical protein HZB07_03280 [Candidatus Saganbacteria bacterium]|nr:hypothetical protein [Candidatus Saganbacteria bacterium]
MELIDRIRFFAAGRNQQNPAWQIPKLTAEESETYRILFNAVRSPNNIDNTALRERYGDFLSNTMRAYISAPLNSNRRIALAEILNELDGFVIRFGFSRRFFAVLFDVISSERGNDLASFSHIAHLADLSVQRATVTVSPAGLPEEVRTILQATGYYQTIDFFSL